MSVNGKKHGLLSQTGTQVPLKEIDVKVQIQGFVAEVTSSLLYSNEEDNPVEASFTFPVDDGSAVYRFEAEIEGRHIVAEIQGKEQAKQTYDDAVSRGSTAMLLEEDQNAGDIFKCTLGNIPPKTDAKIAFSYVLELPQEADGQIRFTLPTVLNPRYSPDVGGLAAADGATYTAPADIPYKFGMVAQVSGYHKVLSVTSTSDKLKVSTADDQSTMVTLDEEFRFDHDLSFLVKYDNCFSPQVILEKGNPEASGMMREDLLMVNFHPELQDNMMSSTGEYIFVIDRSGSMMGNRMKNAKEALFLFLKSLPAGCYFNIVSFGSSYSSLFKLWSGRYTQSNLDKALALQKTMEADMGGTEIYKPLQNVLSKSLIKGHPRQVFLLTDGEVYNTKEVIGLVKANAEKARVFTLGIGSGVSTTLIKRVAEAGNGKADFISDKERIQQKVLKYNKHRTQLKFLTPRSLPQLLVIKMNERLFQSQVISLLKCAALPSVSNIELDWKLPNERNVALIPSQLPSLISVGERLCIYALLTGGTTESSCDQCSLTLKGHLDNKPVQYKMTFSFSQETVVSVTSPLHRLAAKEQIKMLETEEAEMLSGGYYSSSDPVTEIRDKITLLSTSANVISKMTAFVAVDKNSKVEGKMVKRSCPVPLATVGFQPLPQQSTYGINTLDCLSEQLSMNIDCIIERGEKLDNLDVKADALQSGACQFKASAGKLKRKTWSSFIPNVNIPSVGDMGLWSKMRNWFSGPDTGSSIKDSDKTKIEEMTPDDKLFEMISLQEISGEWKLSKEIVDLLGVNIDTIQSMNYDVDNVTTAAVIIWLRRDFMSKHDELEMIEMKALSWLKTKLAAETDLTVYLEEIHKALWPNGI